MVILGIDPGLATVGYGVLKYEKHRFTALAYNVITTPAHTPVEDRLMAIYDELQQIIDLHKPDDLSVEELFFNNNQKTVMAVCEARGVILLCARRNGLNISEYTPLQVKQAVVGYGRAEKVQVQAMVKNILNLEKVPKPDDAADAVALAICHAHSKPTNSLFAALNAK